MVWLKRIAIGLVGLFVVIQLKPVDRTNPPVESEMPAPAEVRAILERACYDCHSNETKWPWYAYVAPVSWRVTDHVEHGREHLNFSTWDRYDARKQQRTVSEILEEVVSGEMPLEDYLPMHPEAVLTPDDIVVLRDWVVDRESETVSDAADAP